MSKVRRHLYHQEVGHFLPVISPKQFDHVSLMEARVPLRNVTNQYPSGSLTPSRPSVTKSVMRRAHSAGKVRGEIVISHPKVRGEVQTLDTSPFSVSDFCSSPTPKKRPSFGRTVIISRLDYPHIKETSGFEPRRPLAGKSPRPDTHESVITVKTDTSPQSPPMSPRRLGFSCDSVSPTHWYSSKKRPEVVSSNHVHEARNLFDQFELDSEVDGEDYSQDIDKKDTSYKRTSFCDQDDIIPKEEFSSFELSDELTMLISEEDTLTDTQCCRKQYQWEPIVKSATNCPYKEMKSFVPTLETVSEASPLDCVILLNSTSSSQLSTEEQTDISTDIISKKKPKRKNKKCCSRRNDTYGAWMQKQVGCSNRFSHIFQALEERHFDEVEKELKAYEEEHETPSLLVVDFPRDDYNNTLLMVACHSGSKRAVRWCLSQGADVDQQNKFNNTALHFAVEFHLNKIAAHLQDKQSANVHIINTLGLTCFQRADYH